MRIWLAYVNDYYTTANYIERALREEHEVITLGPTRDETVEVTANGIKRTIRPKANDIQTPLQIDLQAILSTIPEIFTPDLFLWVESSIPFHTLNINALPCPSACYLIDSHMNIKFHKFWSKEFDYVFIAQREYINEFKEAGIENVFWLPLGCDPGIHGRKQVEQQHDITFVGGIQPGSRREQLLEKLSQHFNVTKKRAYRDEMSETYSAGKIVFNNAIKNDLNMRVFEAMCTGSLLITDNAKKSGQDELFIDGEDLVVYNDDNIIEVFEKYLADDDERKMIAERGRETVLNAHTYLHRMRELVAVVKGEKESTPTAAEWRALSQSDNARKRIIRSSESGRSFIIPVLDLSPDSPYSILSLLSDLERIDGTVITVFNSTETAEQLKDHPRIDHYAVLSSNIGVSRAWNIGLNIARTPVSFILNSDLAISYQTVRTLENALAKYEDAAVTGPEGSFFNFFTSADYEHFRKSGFVIPYVVDAVSGFLFAVKTELFNSGILKFDNTFTPCYFEEWDLGLQVRAAGLKSYIVPAFGYDHEFSIVKQKDRKIAFYNEVEPVGSIHARNREYFWKKWFAAVGISDYKNIAKDDPRLKRLQSVMPESYIAAAKEFIATGKLQNAVTLLSKIAELFPAEAEAHFLLAQLAETGGNPEAAITYYKKTLELDPSNQKAAGRLKALTK